jgi:L-threonylcarbamoyladenylate synthase
MITRSIDSAVKVLKKGKVIGLPTETVYGLAANCFDEKAIRKIYELKNRPADNPLIVHVKDVNAVRELVGEIPDIALRLMHHFWPGPLTVLLPKSHKISDLVTSSSPLVALRSPDHPMALELLNRLDFPLVAPSANPFMSVSPTCAGHVYSYFGEEIPVILDGGNCLKGIESTIVGFENNEIIIYREGIITEDDIKIRMNGIKINKIKNKHISHPGKYKRHYAPKTPLIISENIPEDLKKYRDKKIAVLAYMPLENIDCFCNAILSLSGSLEEAAQNLYATMILMDNSGADLILTELVPETGLGTAINEKLRKASTLQEI